MSLVRGLQWRLVPIQIGALAAFLLIPVWYRFNVRFPPPFFLSRMYVNYFLLTLPLLWTIGWWLITGLPGLRALLSDPLRRLWALLVLLLALWAYASLMWSFMRDLHPEVGATAALQLAVVLLFAVACACAGPPPRAVVGALVVGMIFSAVITILQAHAQSAIGLHALNEFPISLKMPGVSFLEAGTLRWMRPYGLLPHPNILAGTLVVGLLASATLLLAQRALLRWLGVIVVSLGSAALLLTFSRASWIAGAAGLFAVVPLLLLPAMRRRFRPQILVAVALVLFIGAAFVIHFRPLLAARVGVGGESIELRSISDRLVYTDFALQSIRQTPILGVGVGDFPWRSSYLLVGTKYDLLGDDVPQVMLSAWAELGLVGLALMVGALVVGIEALLRRFRALRTQSADTDGANTAARIGLLAAVMALIAVGLLDHYPYTLLHLQVAWWGCLAAALRLPPSPPAPLPGG